MASKTIWLRVGMTVPVTDKQYTKLKAMFDDEDIEELEAPDWLIKRAEKYGVIDGDSYIPWSVMEEW